MSNKLVVINKENEGRAGTLLVAKGFGRRHDQVIRLIRKYRENFENLSPLKGEKISGKGKPITQYWLTEDQFFFLGTLFKNSPIVVKFKERLVREFSRTRKMLARAKSQQSDQKWIMSRDLGKEVRLEETEAIRLFVKYAKSQGSQNADRYYTVITKMTNSLLFIFTDRFKHLRNLLSGRQLMSLSSAEQIINKGLRDCMKKKMFYKDIYKEIKDRVTEFVKLHGNSEVIEQQLKLED